MIKFKFLFALMLLLCLTAPAYNTIAQDNSGSSQTTVQVDETDNTITVDKKDKKKNDVEINDKFLFNLLINIATMLIIIFLIYYPNNRQIENIFTFFMFNLMIFMLTFVLNKIKLSMGAAFGLFAVFSMLRYRTEGISMKDMTYLFIFIGIGLISAIRLDYYELGIINGVIVLCTFLLDCRWIIKRENSKTIEYENIELVKKEHNEKLLEDLRARTGLKVHRIDIERIDFLKDSAKIKVFYFD